MGKHKPSKPASETTPSVISLDGDEAAAVTLQVNIPGCDNVTSAEEIDRVLNDAPTHPAFLDGPKTKPAAGEGTGGRPWVYSDGVMRRTRQGDEVRPRCPGCTRDDVAVLCTAKSSREVTHYRCECCKSFRTEKLRPAIAAQMKAGSYSPPNKSPFVERP